jgi:hypothetical protein
MPSNKNIAIKISVDLDDSIKLLGDLTTALSTTTSEVTKLTGKLTEYSEKFNARLGVIGRAVSKMDSSIKTGNIDKASESLKSFAENSKAVGVSKTTNNYGKETSSLKTRNDAMLDGVYTLDKFKKKIDSLGDAELSGALNKLYGEEGKKALSKNWVELEKSYNKVVSSSKSNTMVEGLKPELDELLEKSKSFSKKFVGSTKDITSVSKGFIVYRNMNKDISSTVLKFEDLEKEINSMGLSSSNIFDSLGGVSSKNIDIVNKNLYKLRTSFDSAGIPFDEAKQMIPNFEEIVSSDKAGLNTVLKNMKRLQKYSGIMKMDARDIMSVIPNFDLSQMQGFGKNDILYGVKQLATFDPVRGIPILVRHLENLGITYEEMPRKLEGFLRGAEGLTRKLPEEAQAFSQFNGELGTTGMVLQQLGKNMLWVGLGSMFTLMSLDRVFTQQFKLKQQALSLLKTNIALKDSEDDLKKIIEEYGAGSEEATKAVRNLNIAKLEAKLASEQMANTQRQEAFALAMSVTSAFGQFVNMGAMMMQTLGPLLTTENALIGTEATRNAIQQSSNATTASSIAIQNIKLDKDKMELALGNQIINITRSETGALIINTSAQGANAGATGLRALFTDLLTGKLKAQVIWTALATVGTQMLTGALVMLPVMLGTLAITMAMTQKQTESLTAETKELEKSINGTIQGSGVVDLTAAFVQYNRTIRDTSSLTATLSSKTERLTHHIDSPSAQALLSSKISLAPLVTSNAPNTRITIGDVIVSSNATDNIAVAKEVKKEIYNSLKSIGVTVI